MRFLSEKLCSALVVVAILIVGALLNPTTVEAGKSQKTVVVASGSASVPANYGSANLVTDLDVSDFATVRIMLTVYNSVCTNQNVAIYFDGYLSPQSPGNLPDCGSPSILVDTAGTTLTLYWLNKDPTNAADVTYEVIGRK